MNHLLTRTAIAVLLGVTASPALLASGTCGVQSFNGKYGLVASGAALALPPPLEPLVGPFGRAGQAVADGKGNVWVEATASYNGYVFEEPFSGTYTVSPDCTIAINLLVGFPGFPPDILIPVTFKGVLVDNGKQVDTVITAPPGGFVHLVLDRQDGSNCSERSLSKGYGVSMAGSIVSQEPHTPGPFFRVGSLEFDGRGGFTATTVANYTGNAVQEDFVGTYSVDSTCHVTIQYTLGQPYTWVGTLTGNGSGADLIVSSPQGAAVVGTLKQK